MAKTCRIVDGFKSRKNALRSQEKRRSRGRNVRLLDFGQEVNVRLGSGKTKSMRHVVLDCGSGWKGRGSWSTGEKLVAGVAAAGAGMLLLKAVR